MKKWRNLLFTRKTHDKRQAIRSPEVRRVGEKPLITFQRNYNQLLAVMFPLCLNADLLEGLL